MVKPRMRKRDGKRVYDVRLRDPGGKEYWRTFETKKDAERYETGQKNARNVGSWIDPRLASTPYRVLADEWLESNPAKRPSSLTRDRAVLRKHVLPVLGDRAVASIKRADIQWLVRSWTERYAPATVDRIFSR